MDRTAARRVLAYTRRQKSRGKVRVTVWVPENVAAAVRLYAAQLRAKEAKEAP